MPIRVSLGELTKPDSLATFLGFVENGGAVIVTRDGDEIGVMIPMAAYRDHAGSIEATSARLGIARGEAIITADKAGADGQGSNG